MPELDSLVLTEQRRQRLKQALAEHTNAIRGITREGERAILVAQALSDQEEKPSRRAGDRNARKAAAGPPPPLLEDVDGYDGKPDPLSCGTEEELCAALREFWQWAGAPSSRTVAGRSGGAFSHTTVCNLPAEEQRRRPPLTPAYLQSLIRALGGEEEEVRQWTTAWRQVRRISTSGTRANGTVVTLRRAAD
ncbi:hypothetical protein [Actinoallomurus iriomotensis]|uniref:hypothetical protein n=1 Tax=Actinoallomurus iriomotensis TaxID=478107 RepID=UPI002555EAE1|nr:hypothetical protein [Actinoallomurus iriomotensis]